MYEMTRDRALARWAARRAGCSSERSRALLVTVGVAVATCLLCIGQDFLHALLRDHRFYLEESALFSGFYLLLFPGLLLQRSLSGSSAGAESVGRHAALLVALPLVQLLLWPAFVVGVSALCFSHSFPYRRTLDFYLAQHVYVCVLVYAATAAHLYHQSPATVLAKAESTLPSAATLPIKQGVHTYLVPIERILFLQVDSPYLAVHTLEKRYLLSSSLRAVEAQFADQPFIRVHRSNIVHLGAVETYVSRTNGDFDLHLRGGHTVRLSRRYREAFLVALAAYSA